MHSLLAFLRRSRPAAVVLALAATALFVPRLWPFLTASILILVGSFVWLLTTPSQPSPAPQTPLEQGKIEYDRLTAFFEKLLSRTLAAFAIIATAAGVLLWKDIRDVRKDAEAVAKSEAKTAIAAQLEEPKLKEQIHEAVQEKVDPAVADAAKKRADAIVGPIVDAAVRKDLGPRIDAFRTLIERTGEIATRAAQLRTEGGTYEGLDALLKDTEDPNPEVSTYAKSALRKAAAEFDSKVPPRGPNTEFFQNTSPKEVMDLILHRRPSSAPGLALYFAYMKRRVGWDVGTFDIPAATKWCAAHKPKCDDGSPGL